MLLEMELTRNANLQCNQFEGQKGERTTKVFAKAELNNVTSAMCKHQRRFRLDVQFSALVVNFNNIFSNKHLYRAGQSMNSQILERYRLC
jgi:hypothetical protein